MSKSREQIARIGNVENQSFLNIEKQLTFDLHLSYDDLVSVRGRLGKLNESIVSLAMGIVLIKLYQHTMETGQDLSVKWGV